MINQFKLIKKFGQYYNLKKAKKIFKQLMFTNELQMFIN